MTPDRQGPSPGRGPASARAPGAGRRDFDEGRHAIGGAVREIPAGGEIRERVRRAWRPVRRRPVAIKRRRIDPRDSGAI